MPQPGASPGHMGSPDVPPALVPPPPVARDPPALAPDVPPVAGTPPALTPPVPPFVAPPVALVAPPFATFPPVPPVAMLPPEPVPPMPPFAGEPPVALAPPTSLVAPPVAVPPELAPPLFHAIPPVLTAAPSELAPACDDASPTDSSPPVPSSGLDEHDNAATTARTTATLFNVFRPIPITRDPSISRSRCIRQWSLGCLGGQAEDRAEGRHGDADRGSRGFRLSFDRRPKRCRLTDVNVLKARSSTA